MASYLPSGIQKRLLRYALLNSGFLDTDSIDLDSLDIALGRSNKIELRDVGLRPEKLSALLQLPPNVRLIAARVLLLRVALVLDYSRTAIVAEVDGIEISLDADEPIPRLDPDVVRPDRRHSTSIKTPQHRKTSRRIHSPDPFRERQRHGLWGEEDEAYVPKAEDLAKSFLNEEPAEEKRELEAQFVSQNKGVEESVTSATSDDGAVGTGTGLGLPGFLAGFLKGVLDRSEIKILNVDVRLSANLGPAGDTNKTTLAFRVGRINLDGVTLSDADAADASPVTGTAEDGPTNFASRVGRRRIALNDLSVSLLCETSAILVSPNPSEFDSPTEQRQPTLNPGGSPTDSMSTKSSVEASNASMGSESVSYASLPNLVPELDTPRPPSPALSMVSNNTYGGRYADAAEDDANDLAASTASFGIRPGEDNASFSARRSQSSSDESQRLWASVSEETDLSASIAQLHDMSASIHASPPGDLSFNTTSRSLRRSSYTPGSVLSDEPPRSREDLYRAGQELTRSVMSDGAQDSLPKYFTRPASTKERSAPDLSTSLAALPANDGSSDEPGTMRSSMYDSDMGASMYMSAVSHGTVGSPEMKIPGGFASGVESMFLPPAAMHTGLEDPEDRAPTPKGANHAEDASVSASTEQGGSGASTPRHPRGISPSDVPITSDQNTVLPKSALPEYSAKIIASLDVLTIWLPSMEDTPQQVPAPASTRPTREAPRASMSSTTILPRQIPGSFSFYADQGASRRLQDSYVQDESVIYGSEMPESQDRKGAAIEVTIGAVLIQADVPTLSLLHQVVTSLVPQSTTSPSGDHSAEHVASPLECSVQVSLFQISLCENLAFVPMSTRSTEASRLDAKPLLRLEGQQIAFDMPGRTRDSEFGLTIGKLGLSLADCKLLSFKDTSGKNTTEPDVSISVSCAKTTLQNRPVREIKARLLPIRLNVDLDAIDDALTSCGGLSGVLELSASALSGSSSPRTEMPKSPQKRGVRFDDQPEPPPSGTEIKFNGSFRGLTGVLTSKTCSLELKCMQTKLLYREKYIHAHVEEVQLYERSGPAPQEPSRFRILLKTIQLTYMLAPENVDLEKLISLLTPSKNKYENDDDILVETLLRQRRKGPVMRQKVSLVQVDVTDWTILDGLKALASELATLSAVTKYLPEDDRPGLLMLPTVAELNSRVPVNDRFGALELSLKDIQAAHIGLPALTALAIGGIRSGPVGGADIVHEVVASADRLPVIMARMIGDEVEPKVKIKLFNLGLEYSVPTILALTGLDSDSDPDQLVSGIAASVMDLAAVERDDVSPSVAPDDSVSRPIKRMGVDVQINDCAIGLKPRDANAKGMLVFTNTRFSTTVPPEATSVATLEIRKASLHIVDSERSNGPQYDALRAKSPATGTSLNTYLASQGFISVSSIMSAKAVITIIQAEDSDQFVDVELHDELFVLETCADSQQTLVEILNGLAPPTPVSKDPAFRTEIMPIEDMMASFSGDAFVRPTTPPQALFDFDSTSPPPSPPPDDLLLESAMGSSLYMPMGPNLDDVDEDFYGGLDADAGDTAESLLEDDPFEITDFPTSKRLSDNALLANLQRQCPASTDAPSAQLKPYYHNDRQLDGLGSGSDILGAPHRFNTPAVQFPNMSNTHTKSSPPLQVRVRDVHVIWNLYDGYDWRRTRDAITDAVEKVETKLEERKARRRRSVEPEDEDESVIADCLFNSIYIDIPARQDVDIRRQISRGIDDLASESESYAPSGSSRPTSYSASSRPVPRGRKKRLRLERSKAHKIAFELKGLSVDFTLKPQGSGEVQSSIDVRIHNFEIFDNVPTSTWRKFLTYCHDQENTREMMKPMFHIEMLNVRPVADLTATEIVMRVSVLPLRLHVDQDALDFITRFFEFKPDQANTTDDSSIPPFIQRIEVNTVMLCLDYKPKKVDYGGLRSGHASEFKNFVILDRANIKLKHAIVYGVRGFDALHATLSDIWTPDVIRNQLPGVLSGLAPIRSFVALGAGVRDVVAIPVREYKKDGRLFRSVQKGAFHFAKTTTAELARLGAKVAIGTQNALQGTEGLLSGDANAGPSRTQTSADSDNDDEDRARRAVSNYADQPLGVLQGLRSAHRYLEHDLLLARDAIIAVQGEVMDSPSPSGVAQAVARHGPTILLRPMIGATGALGRAFLGVGNQVDRGNYRTIEDKYKPGAA